MQSSEALCLGEMLPIKVGFREEWLWVYGGSAPQRGARCPCLLRRGAWGLSSTAVLRRSLGQTDPGWDLTCTTCCVTLGKWLEVSQIWLLGYKMEENHCEH